MIALDIVYGFLILLMLFCFWKAFEQIRKEHRRRKAEQEARLEREREAEQAALLERQREAEQAALLERQREAIRRYHQEMAYRQETARLDELRRTNEGVFTPAYLRPHRDYTPKSQSTGRLRRRSVDDTPSIVPNIIMDADTPVARPRPPAEEPAFRTGGTDSVPSGFRTGGDDSSPSWKSSTPSDGGSKSDWSSSSSSGSSSGGNGGGGSSE